MTDDRKKEAIACIVFASYLIDICKFQGTIEEFGAKYKISFAVNFIHYSLKKGMQSFIDTMQI